MSETLVCNHRSELPVIIKTAPSGATILVGSDTLKQLGEIAADRMTRKDLVFAVGGTADANDDLYKVTTSRWDTL